MSKEISQVSKSQKWNKVSHVNSDSGYNYVLPSAIVRAKTDVESFSG